MDDATAKKQGELGGTMAPDQAARTRRGFLGALIAAVVSALLIGLLWLLSRGAPSAGRDPAWTPPAIP